MKSSERTIVFTPKLLHSFTPYTKQVIFNHESHSKFAVDCDVSRITQEIWNKN